MADIRINALATTAASTASDDFVAVDGSANGTRKLNAFSPTFGGNLTVSGTGTSALTSSSANLVVGSTTATSTNAVGVPQITTESDLYSSICSMAHNNTNGNHGFLMVGKSRGTKASPTILADGDVFGELGFVAYDGAAYRTAGQIRSVIAGTPGATDLPCALDFRVAPDGSSTPATAMRIAPTGNLLLKSDGIDSSNGKLQLATHTTIAGGIGFGTDTSLYRYTAGRLGLAHIGGGTPTLYLLEGTTETARLWTANGPCYLDTLTAQPIYFRPSGTTALTLDSSQNATFAGTVTASKAYQDITSGLSTIYAYSTDTATQDKGGTIQLGGAYTGTTTTTFGGIRGSKESTTAGETGGQLEFFTRSNGGAMARRAYISSTGAATFTGNIGAGGVNPVVAYSSGGSFYGSGANPQVRLVATSTGGWAFSTYTNVSATGNWSAGLQATGQTYRITNDLDLNGTAALSIAPTTLATTFGGTISTSAPTGGAGAWELGVYTATAPTATGYVTIEIGGTQYKLLAATA